MGSAPLDQGLLAEGNLMSSPKDWMAERQQQEEEERFRLIAQDVAQRQRTRIRTQHVKNILGRLTTTRGFAAQQTNRQLEQAWNVAVGNQMARLTQVGEIRRGVLQITVKQSVVAQELGFRRHDLVKKLQNSLPDADIRDLRFRVGILKSSDKNQ